jgi:MoxR-like ATPase
MLTKLKSEIHKVVVGKDSAIELLTVALLAGGHVLIEDLPGLGKTTLAKAFSDVIDCRFSRVQFTPDLMPSDLIGVAVYDAQTKGFTFHKGPVFTNVLLADEINRTSPKTQSSLLEAMAEGQVTSDGTVYGLDRPFMVIATENPIEMAGTFPLPEAQLDRFMMRLSLGYPSIDEEMAILETKAFKANPETIFSKQAILEAMQSVENLYVAPAIRQYIVSLCHATRTHEDIRIGASPRASVHLFQAARARAFLNGRDYVTSDDVKALFEVVVGHRLTIKGDALYRGQDSASILQKILRQIPT